MIFYDQYNTPKICLRPSQVLISKNVRFPYRLPRGFTCRSIGEVYERLVQPFLPAVEAVRGWHELLFNSLESKDTCIFVRRYHSGKNQKEYLRCRRGFVTYCGDELCYVFVDNALAQVIYTLAANGNVPTLKEWREAIADRTLPVSYGSTAAETALRVFHGQCNPGLNKAGFKLCHVLDVGSGTDGHTWEALFPRGTREDWHPISHIRVLPSVDPEIRARMVAHFVRYLHPANLFVCAGVKLHTIKDSPLGNESDIGESQALLEYVTERFSERYGEVWKWVQVMAMPEGRKRPIPDGRWEIVVHENRKVSGLAKEFISDLGSFTGQTSETLSFLLSNFHSRSELTNLFGSTIIVAKRSQFHIDKHVEALLRGSPIVAFYVLVIQPMNPERSVYVPGVYILPRSIALAEIDKIRERSPKFEMNGWTRSKPPERLQRWFYAFSRVSEAELSRLFLSVL